MFSKQSVIFSDLGRMGYRETWDLQEDLLRQNVEAKIRKRNASAVPVINAGGSDDSEMKRLIIS